MKNIELIRTVEVLRTTRFLALLRRMGLEGEQTTAVSGSVAITI